MYHIVKDGISEEYLNRIFDLEKKQKIHGLFKTNDFKGKKMWLFAANATAWIV